MIPGENFAEEFLDELDKGDFHRFYLAEDGDPWIVGFYEADSDDLDGDDPFVFGTLAEESGSWIWKRHSPADHERFWSFAQEVELPRFRDAANQFKKARAAFKPTDPGY